MAKTRGSVAVHLVVTAILVSSSLAWISAAPIAASSRPTQRQAHHASSSPDGGEETPLESILHQYGYDSRLITIYDSDLPLLAEAYVNGQSVIGQVAAFQPASGGKEQEPKVRFDFLSGDDDSSSSSSQVLDLGQITTIWEASSDDMKGVPLVVTRQDFVEQVPVAKFESALDSLYRGRVGRARSATSGITKKQLSKLTAKIENPEEQQHTENVLRKVLKAGSGMSRLVDSFAVSSYLKQAQGSGDNDEIKALQRQAISAHLLSNDASTGGRFKRFPTLQCNSVSVVQGASTGDTSPVIDSVTLINGGWLVLDQSVRAGTEARKFVERSQVKGPKVKGIKTTAADERITRRLECLAMGELFAGDDDRGPQAFEDSDLQLDVRETLSAMDLPLSPSGATEALIRIGRWSGKENFAAIEPWPKRILDAAFWYAEMNRERSLSNQMEEGRIDLTMYPCVSVDAKRTTFRDDAIGVRPRASTGRKVDTDASKYEILIHIADVSDIYSPNPSVKDTSGNLLLLQKAAESRGTSRYDLPLGPLHLLPPVALKALALSNDSQTNNRCVTLWVYIDERNGRILDAGLERTLTAPPIKLSFADASKLLGDSIKQSSEAEVAKARAIVQVADRNLKVWSTVRQQNSESARKREARLAAREDEGRQKRPYGKNMADNGRGGFVRTRGHLLVDSSLDLYGYAISKLLQRSKAPIPRTAGADASRGGRVATAPLRRYIDGVSQRQALAVLCKYGGSPMTLADCIEVGKVATDAKNAISNISAMRKEW